MKKFILFISSVICFVGCFLFLNLYSFADSDAGVGMLNGEYTFSSYQGNSWLSNASVYVTTAGAPLPENRFLFVVSNGDIWVMSENYILNGVDRDDFGWRESRSYYDSGRLTELDPQTHTSSGPITGLFQDYDKLVGLSVSTNALFDSPASALVYLQDGDEEGMIGGSIVPPSPSIDWGDNDPNDVDNPWRPDTENIPAPQFEVVYDSNGNVTNQIRFTNYIYNYSAGHGEDRIYGLRMTVMWNTYGSFVFDHTGGLLSQEYKVTYSDMLVGDIDTVLPFPERENQIVRCPQTFNFNTNQAVIDSFNSLLQTYDVDERTYNTNFSLSNDLTLTNKFKSFLERITCPYNTITFSVQYYREMSDGTFHYGPWSTGKFTAPQQGAIFNANGVTLSGVGGMVQGNGGGLSGTDESGNWNNNWGNNTSDNLFDLSNLEIDKVKANMTGLFSLFGDMPTFIQQCFLFLPDWVIAFIIGCIVLVCAIGALKLAIG